MSSIYILDIFFTLLNLTLVHFWLNLFFIQCPQQFQPLQHQVFRLILCSSESLIPILSSSSLHLIWFSSYPFTPRFCVKNLSQIVLPTLGAEENYSSNDFISLRFPDEKPATAGLCKKIELVRLCPPENNTREKENQSYQVTYKVKLDRRSFHRFLEVTIRDKKLHPKTKTTQRNIYLKTLIQVLFKTGPNTPRHTIYDLLRVEIR